MFNRNSISEHYKFKKWEKDPYFERYNKREDKKIRQTGFQKKKSKRKGKGCFCGMFVNNSSL